MIPVTIHCGRCHVTHDSVAAVRACFGGADIFPCNWLVSLGLNEDGEDVIIECGANAWCTDRGSDCSNGHEHVNVRTRMAEHWDYAADQGEADSLRRHGVDAVGMDGGSI